MTADRKLSEDAREGDLTAIADAATHWLDLAARPSTDTPAADDTETGT